MGAWRQTFRLVTAKEGVSMFRQSPLSAIQLTPPKRAICAIVALLAFASGCATTRLSTVRQKMAAGQYAAARQQLLAIPIASLSPPERREVKDDLCLSTFMIGEPSFAQSEQLRVCEDAAKEPGSQSQQFVEKIDDQILRSSAAKVNAALASGDLGGAEQAAQRYLNTPGADPAVVAKWSHQMWELVTKRDQRIEPRHKKKELAAAIESVRKEYPAVRKMSKDEFMAWVAKQGDVEGTAMFSAVAVKDKELDVAIGRRALHTASLKLDRFSTINDATVTRCGCDGRTNVGVAETN